MDQDIQQEIEQIFSVLQQAKVKNMGSVSDMGVSQRTWSLYARRFNGRPICIPTVEDVTRLSYLLDIPGFQAGLGVVASYAKSTGENLPHLSARIAEILDKDRVEEVSPLWMSLQSPPNTSILANAEVKFLVVLLAYLSTEDWDGDLQDVDKEMRNLNAITFPEDSITELMSARLNELKRIFGDFASRGLIEMRDADEMVQVCVDFAIRCGVESGRSEEVAEAIEEIKKHPDVKCSECQNRCMAFSDGNGVFERMMAGKRSTAIMDKIMYSLHLMTIPLMGVNSASISSDTVDELFCSIRGIIQDASERTGIPIHEDNLNDKTAR